MGRAPRLRLKNSGGLYPGARVADPSSRHLLSACETREKPGRKLIDVVRSAIAVFFNTRLVYTAENVAHELSDSCRCL